VVGIGPGRKLRRLPRRFAASDSSESDSFNVCRTESRSEATGAHEKVLSNSLQPQICGDCKSRSV